MARQTKIDPRIDPEVYSYGSNALDAKDIFFERIKYDIYMFPDFLAKNFVSTWTTERNYGTINNKGNATVPDLRRLKSLQFASEEGRTQYALDFVADAWYDFARRVRELASINVIFKNSPWANPEIVKAWEPAQNDYDVYMREQIYPVFYDDFLYAQSRNKDIKGISDFLNEFDKFMQDSMVRVGPVTLSSFIESNYAPVYGSGLVIEIASDDYDDDFNKAYKFGDKNFSLVANLAAQYGFSIDKNIPWRLVADLRNPAMLEYMLGVPIEGFDIRDNVEYICEPLIGDVELPPMAYGFSQIPGLEDVRRTIAFYTYEDDEGNDIIEPGYRRYKRRTGEGWEPSFNTASQPETFDALFRTDYTETWNQDMELLQEYLLFFYNYYVSLQPSVVVQTPVPFDSRCGPRTFSFTRDPVTPEIFNTIYGNRWKLKNYYVIRKRERMGGRFEPLKRRLYEIQDVLNNYNLALARDSDSAYARALRILQNEYIGPADTDPLTLRTVGDIIGTE